MGMQIKEYVGYFGDKKKNKKQGKEKNSLKATKEKPKKK